METTRLSSVITGWGGNDTTCSRKSINGRTLSMKGTTTFSPGSSVLWYLPSRSTTPARACGMIRMARKSVTSTKIAMIRMTTLTTMVTTSWVTSFMGRSSR